MCQSLAVLAAGDFTSFLIVVGIMVAYAVIGALNKAAEKQKKDQVRREAAARRRAEVAEAVEVEADGDEAWQAPKSDVEDFLKRVMQSRSTRAKRPAGPPRQDTGDLEVLRPEEVRAQAVQPPMAEPVAQPAPPPVRRPAQPSRPKRRSSRPQPTPTPDARKRKAKARPQSKPRRGGLDRAAAEAREPMPRRALSIPMLGGQPLDVRQAIIMMEVLGPPRSRRPLRGGPARR